ncbi:YvcK family protein [Patescibacteria group bacterium]|nr:YvcK family protein [Patescibacteria group bacterium]
MKKVVVIGGGTGTFATLSGLKKFPVDLTAVVTVADDGGSTGRLRDQFGILPPGDFRMALVALSSEDDDQQVLRQLFLYRFSQGEEGLRGHNFGNLFLAALTDILGTEEKALAYASKILRIKGRVLPVTTNPVTLVAQYENGEILKGEHDIDEPPPSHDYNQKIKDLWVEPDLVCSPMVTDALLDADLVVLGPGDLYTSILANVVVRGVSTALQKTRGKIAYVVNLMTKFGQTNDFSASDHVLELRKYLGKLPDLVLVDNTKYPTKILDLYKEENNQPVLDDLKESGDYLVVREHLSSDLIFAKSKGDALKGSLIRHDPDKLAWELMKYIKPF